MTELIVTTPAPYVVIDLAATITGLSTKAIRRKIEDGIWIKGREYRRAPDGRIYISIKGYTQWVEAGSTCARTPSASRSRTAGASTAARSI